MAKRTRQLEGIAQLFRVLSDETRLRIIEELQRGGSNVTALVKKLKVAQPTVSHHLAIMRMAGIVASRRSGKSVFYALVAGSVESEKALSKLFNGAAGMQFGNVVIGLSSRG